jgi:multicomponent Na+:H+ antiporter subunit D
MPATGQAGLLPLMVVVPITTAAVIVAISRAVPRQVVDALSAATAVAVGALGIVVLGSMSGSGDRTIDWLGGWHPGDGRPLVGLVLIGDRVGVGLAVLAAAVMACALPFGWQYFDTVGGHFQPLMLMFLSGMEGFALSGDLFDMFVFFELMGAAAYALTAFNVEDRSSLQGGLNFAVVNSLGAYFSLAGVAILYSRTGVLQLPLLAKAVDARGVSSLVVLAFVLVVAGFLVKGAVAPLHFWAADAHAVAPTPVCILFSGVMDELGLYGIARVYVVVFGGTIPPHAIRIGLMSLGVLTAIVGTVMCMSQHHLKRLLAYSTIGHVGLFLVAFVMLSDSGLGGALMYVIGHAGAKSALFLLAGIMLNRYGTLDEIALFGRGRGHRLMPALFVVGGLALAACPPFGTGLGKSFAESATLHGGFAWLVALFVLVSAGTAAAVLRATMRVYFGLGDKPGDGTAAVGESVDDEPDVSRPLARVPATMMAAVLALLAGSFVAGTYPGFGEAVGKAAHQFLDRGGYVAQSLAAGGPASAPPGGLPHVADMHWTALGVELGLASAALAVVLAVLALYGPRLPRVLRGTAEFIARPIQFVRQAHSGHIGDYVAWMLFGLAALGALVGVPLR